MRNRQGSGEICERFSNSPVFIFLNFHFQYIPCPTIFKSCRSIPESGIDGVVLGHFAVIGKAVGEHAVGNIGRPREQNLARVAQSFTGDVTRCGADTNWFVRPGLLALLSDRLGRPG